MSRATPRAEGSRTWSQGASVAPPSSASRRADTAGGGGHAEPSHAGVTATPLAPHASKENPYAGHRQLRPREQEVLGEYAKLAATIKRIEALSTNAASSERHAPMLRDLRVLERKMGLVLTLFKASVWSLIQTHQDELEQQQQQDAQEQHDVEGEEMGGRYGDDDDDGDIGDGSFGVAERDYTLRAGDAGDEVEHMSNDRQTSSAPYRTSRGGRTRPSHYNQYR